MKQDSLFGGTDAYGTPIVKAPHVAGSDTSEQAAIAITPHLNELQRRVLDYVRACGMDGCTDEQIIDALGISPSTARPRRIELTNAGLVLDSGRTRKTKSGRNAVVWIANQAG